MKTLIALFLLIPIVCFAQYRQGVGGQINNYRTGPIAGDGPPDRAFWGTFIRASVQYSGEKFYMAQITMRTQGGETRVYTMRNRNYITRNGYPAIIEDAVLGEMIGGTTVGESDIVRNLTITSPSPPRVAKPKTNSTPSTAQNSGSSLSKP